MTSNGIGPYGYDVRVFLDEAGIPDLESLQKFHHESHDSFAMDFQFGLFETRDRVAGFEPHAMYFDYWNGNLIPEGNDVRENPVNWKVNRLELVSLVVHDEPVVYSSDHLPKMDQLSEHETRPLNAFEADSLGRIVNGEDLVTNATAHRIEMLGSVRAASSCTECHGVKRGELLGAFSYELIRVPQQVENAEDEETEAHGT